MLFIKPEDITINGRKGGNILGQLNVTCPLPIAYLRASGMVTEFQGVNSVLDYLHENMTEPQQAKASNSRLGQEGKNFHLFKDYKTALDVYTNSPESVREFSEKDLVLDGGDSAGLQVNYDVTGDFLDVDRYLSGEPEHFGYMDNGVPRGKRMMIVTTNDWVYSTDKETINTRSKRILRLIDWLESQGIRTSMVALTSSECGHHEIIIKHFDEPLDLNAVAVVSHSDWLRRIMFRFIEYSYTYQQGYGTSSLCGSMLNHFTNLDQLPYQLQDSHVLFVGQGGDPDKEFNKLEDTVATMLSNDEENKLMKVML